MADEVLTVEGVAARYGVNPQTVRRWLASGKVRGFRVGPSGVWRVRASDLDRLEAGGVQFTRFAGPGVAGS